MEDFNIREHIISCREDTNDYRLCLTMQQIEYLEECQMRYNLVKEIGELLKDGDNKKM